MSFWHDEPINDDDRLENVNVRQVSDAVVALLKSRKAGYQSNAHLLIPFGCVLRVDVVGRLNTAMEQQDGFSFPKRREKLQGYKIQLRVIPHSLVHGLVFGTEYGQVDEVHQQSPGAL